MWKVFPFKELSNQEPSGPGRQTSPALDLVIKALSVSTRVGQTPVGEWSPPHTTSTDILYKALRELREQVKAASKTILESRGFYEK